jgi:hypothetical protein
MHLEDLTPDITVRGILADSLVNVVGVEWHGPDALTLFYRSSDGKVENETLYRHDERRLEILQSGGQQSLIIGAQRPREAALSLAKERQLEDLLASAPQLLSSDWMIIGRQEHTDTGGRIDLLAITPESSLVLIELKRDRTPREIVAQTLEYAAWVEQLTPKDIRRIYKRFSKGEVLDDAYKEHFGFDLDLANLNNSHQIVIVASELDASSERIIAYLNARNIVINFLLFQIGEHAACQHSSQLQPPNKLALFDVAQGQGGFFTAKQAEAAGFQRRNHAYHVRAGNWAREGRGIFRLKHFPAANQADLVLWSLWSRNRSDQPMGVYSHETALRIFDLSDLMPAKLHMTVPQTFRRNTPVPKALVLHRGNLDATEVEARDGYRVTRPLKTLIDLINEGTLAEETLRSAFADAVQKGLITQSEIAQNQDALASVIAAARPPHVS